MMFSGLCRVVNNDAAVESMLCYDLVMFDVIRVVLILPRRILLVSIGLKRPQQGLKQPVRRHGHPDSIMIWSIALLRRCFPLEEVATGDRQTEVIAITLLRLAFPTRHSRLPADTGHGTLISFGDYLIHANIKFLWTGWTRMLIARYTSKNHCGY